MEERNFFELFELLFRLSCESNRKRYVYMFNESISMTAEKWAIFSIVSVVRRNQPRSRYLVSISSVNSIIQKRSIYTYVRRILRLGVHLPLVHHCNDREQILISSKNIMKEPLGYQKRSNSRPFLPWARFIPSLRPSYSFINLIALIAYCHRLWERLWFWIADG